MTAYIFRELTPATWPDFERLFRGPGGNDHCWCMYYRRGQSAAKEAAEYRVKRDGFPEHNRRRNEALVREGRSHGILVYEEGVPIGWCAYGRADEFPAIDRGPSPIAGPDYTPCPFRQGSAYVGGGLSHIEVGVVDRIQPQQVVPQRPRALG